MNSIGIVSLGVYDSCILKGLWMVLGVWKKCFSCLFMIFKRKIATWEDGSLVIRVGIAIVL